MDSVGDKIDESKEVRKIKWINQSTYMSNGREGKKRSNFSLG